MADSNFEGTNLLGGPFKPYVNMNKWLKDKPYVWSIQKPRRLLQNEPSAYLALASSVNIDNTKSKIPTYSRVAMVVHLNKWWSIPDKTHDMNLKNSSLTRFTLMEDIMVID
jgi:hypothetical protein